MIEKDGETFYTGGFLLNDTPQIRTILDAVPKAEQYEFVKSIKVDPFLKFYYDEAKVREQEGQEIGRKAVKHKSKSWKDRLLSKLAGA